MQELKHDLLSKTITDCMPAHCSPRPWLDDKLVSGVGCRCWWLRTLATWSPNFVDIIDTSTMATSPLLLYCLQGGVCHRSFPQKTRENGTCRVKIAKWWWRWGMETTLDAWRFHVKNRARKMLSEAIDGEKMILHIATCEYGFTWVAISTSNSWAWWPLWA
jgi:hypothetical protein